MSTPAAPLVRNVKRLSHVEVPARVRSMSPATMPTSAMCRIRSRSAPPSWTCWIRASHTSCRKSAWRTPTRTARR